MKRLSQIGWVCACIGLLAPATARAEAISVSATAYEASFVHFAVDRENARESKPAEISLFSLCRKCATPHASPFLASTNLSGGSKGEKGGFDFKGGFSASFGGGGFAFPVPAMSSTTAGSISASASSTPSITLPLSPAGDDDHAAAAGGGSSAALAAQGGGLLHPTDQVVASVATTGRAALTKAESLAATPEPATLFLLGVGLIGLAGRTWKQFA